MTRKHPNETFNSSRYADGDRGSWTPIIGTLGIILGIILLIICVHQMINEQPTREPLQQCYMVELSNKTLYEIPCNETGSSSFGYSSKGVNSATGWYYFTTSTGIFR